MSTCRSFIIDSSSSRGGNTFTTRSESPNTSPAEETISAPASAYS